MPFASRLLLAAALVLVFLTSWIVLPAPNRPLLALGVGAPELSAWLVFGGLVVCVLTLGAAGRDTLARATLVLAAVATVLASVPLVRLPFVVRRFDGTMRTALGEDFLHGVPSDRRVRMRRAPIAVLDLFLGIDVGEARVTRDVLFAAPDGVRLTLDIYRPVTAGRHPSVVQIYGGAWQRGAPGDDARFATYLAARGFVVFAIDYRHAPQWQWPAQIEDVRTSLGWIREHGGEYGADASRLALLGRSAGAQLAMVAAYERGALLISAVVGWYGPVDLADGYRNPPRPDPLDVRSIEEAFLGGTPDLVPDRYREASPITYVSRRLPPSLLIYGSRDHVVLPR
ncbi:MAG: alpha/beta hydrolase, partial [Acidobacteria bacterium]|nr:alpha/beta hydrolase [Acidobacteriota bacterium]